MAMEMFAARTGRSGTQLMGSIRPIYNIWETVQKIFFTIDDEGLYDEPIVHTVGEIARARPRPITFQYRMDNRLIGF